MRCKLAFSTRQKAAVDESPKRAGRRLVVTMMKAMERELVASRESGVERSDEASVFGDRIAIMIVRDDQYRDRLRAELVEHTQERGAFRPCRGRRVVHDERDGALRFTTRHSGSLPRIRSAAPHGRPRAIRASRGPSHSYARHAHGRGDP